ncbi:MAG: hypothetical protein MK212_20370, partial [Saprospiraceae bacterium]|nr:hypothetical protein [Saprospiraceae bacterium]
MFIDTSLVKLMSSWCLLFFIGLVQAQVLDKQAQLPEILNENSGMVVIDTHQIWLHNDGGNAPYLYQLNAKGEIQKKVRILNDSNKDWEDMCTDGNEFFYLGDFGNNRNNRKDLKILKIPYLPELKDTTVEAEFIEFTYPEQKAFPPEDHDLHYDMEAMIYYKAALYLFTKNRTKPYSGYTYLYKLPVGAGTHEAVLLDSFDTGQKHWFYSVTGAAVSPNQEKIALLAGNQLWIFSDFE